MDTIEMLVALTASNNTSCSSLAWKILKGQSTIQNELKYTGTFMKYVLKGQYSDAIDQSDLDNRDAFGNGIINLVNEKEFAKLQEEVNYLIYKQNNPKLLSQLNSQLIKVADNYTSKSDNDFTRIQAWMTYFSTIRNEPQYINHLIEDELNFNNEFNSI